MFELLSRFNAGELIGLVAVLGGVLITITAMLSHYLWKARRAEAEVALKQEMLKQGKSVEEIERVVRASAVLSEDFEERENEVDVIVEVVEAMLEKEQSGEEIARMIRAYDPATHVPYANQGEFVAALKRAVVRKMAEYGSSGEEMEQVLRACDLVTDVSHQVG